MPKFKLTEIDNTGSLQLNPITNVIYIPGKASAKMNTPELCSSVADLANLMDSAGLVDDLSYKLAKRCLQLGMQVLYQGFIADDSSIVWHKGSYKTSIETNEEDSKKYVTISGVAFEYDEANSKLITVEKYGSPKARLEFAISNGTCVIDSALVFVGIPTDPETGNAQYQTILMDYINSSVGYNWLGISGGGIQFTDDDWNALSDKALYDIRFLTSGAYPSIVSESMKVCAETRKDCVALIDHTSDIKTVSAIREFLQQFNSKHVAAFTPWWTSNVEELGSELIPPSFGYLFAYARSIQSNPTWFPVAGTFRGNIPELKSVEKKYSTAEIEMLQGRAANKEVELDADGDNVGIAINPIAFIKGYGYLIWGNRTLVINAGYTKATSFLNVRNLCSDIVKTLYSASKKYTFEQNSNTLWLNFKHEIQPLLDRMVSGNGIVAYTIEQLPTTAKARLKARITISPIEGLEDFELELYLEDSLEVIE